MTFCSWKVGWRSLLMRAYDDPPQAEEFTTSATNDQLIVLVTKGSCNIESFRNNDWSRAAYRPGDIGMIPSGEVARLRWRGSERHTTLQLHLPDRVIAAVADDLRNDNVRVAMPSCLAERDTTMAAIMISLHRAALAGAPDLYAEAGAHFLAAHLLTHHCRITAWPAPSLHREALRHVDAYMRARLNETFSLGGLAEIAGISRFQLLRAANATWRETPIQHLTHLRMERARHLLLSGRRAISEIAVECGYENGAHFATAFKRHFGVSPSGLRKR
jgi:AraC family transcriptional regulator